MMTMNFRRHFTNISRVSSALSQLYLIGLTFRKFCYIKAQRLRLEILLAAHASFLLLCILFIARDPSRKKLAHLPVGFLPAIDEMRNMKVSKDVAEQGHLDLAIVLNERTLGRGGWRRNEGPTSYFCLFFSKPLKQVICLEGLTVTFSKNETLFFRYFLDPLIFNINLTATSASLHMNNINLIFLNKF